MKKATLLLAVCMLVVCFFVACDNGTPPTEPVPLGTPQVSLSGDSVVWGAVENAEGYAVEINGTEYRTDGLFYKIRLSAPGSAEVRVKALASDGSGFVDGSWSETLTYTFSAIKLAPPELTVNGNNVSWQSIQGASEYEIFIDGTSQGRQSETVYALVDVHAGKYSVTVKAIAASVFYTDSELSAAVEVVIEPTVLNTPVLQADGTRFFWTSIDGAVGYEVYVNGESAGVVNGTEYVLEPTEYRIYKVRVKALAGDPDHTDSALSAEMTYERVKPVIAAPVLYVDEESGTVSWEAVDGAGSYRIFLNGEEKEIVTDTFYTPEEYGEYSVRVQAVAQDPENYADSELSSAVTVLLTAPADLSKPFYVYSKHLIERIGAKYVMGIADDDNYDTLSDAYKATLDNNIDNYLCNMPTGENWTDEDYAAYAWLLEEVTDYTGTTGVIPGEKIYRIRLTDGTYLSVAKNNHIGTSNDYITSSVYVKNDIWQYWQFVKAENGGRDEYYIYNIGHGWDWGRTNDFLTDTSRNDGGAELYPMDEATREWFPYTVVNVDGAVFDETAVEDYSGKVVFHNFGTGKVYGFSEGDVALKQLADWSADEDGGEFTWTLEKVDYDGMTNVYRIRLADGRYLTYGTGYVYEAHNLVDDISTPQGQAQLFVLDPVHGVKNGFKIGHIYDGTFIDSNDGQMRYYALDGAGNIGGQGEGIYVSRQWGSIDWRNHLSNIWIMETVG